MHLWGCFPKRIFKAMLKFSGIVVQHTTKHVIPAEAGIQLVNTGQTPLWIPAFAGMTKAQTFCHTTLLK